MTGDFLFRLRVNEDSLRWMKMNKKDIPQIENILLERENDCVSACGRFIERHPSSERIWCLKKGNRNVKAFLISSRSTLIPVLCGFKEIPHPDLLNVIFKIKKIHSIQGSRDEVIILEKAMERTGRVIADIFDYDLMSLDRLPEEKKDLKNKNLKLRVPQIADLDEIAPLQEAYEKEEVIPKGSSFNPEASRINIANIISKGQILAAELDGALVGKINVSAVSYTRYLVGGVFVHPDFRGRGIGRIMTAEFLRTLVLRGKGVTLFVKKNNPAARRLYLRLGFSGRGDYRITYY